MPRGRKLAIGYIDETGAVSERVVRPFLVGYMATVRVVAALCDLRRDFRVLCTDRLTAVAFLDERYPERSVFLRCRWLAMIRQRQSVQ